MQAGNTLYISGQLGLDTATLNLVSEDVVEQTRTALTNMGHILEAAGCTYKHGKHSDRTTVKDLETKENVVLL